MYHLIAHKREKTTIILKQTSKFKFKILLFNDIYFIKKKKLNCFHFNAYIFSPVT